MDFLTKELNTNNQFNAGTFDKFTERLYILKRTKDIWI
jgi:hypothetical protein